MGSLVGIRYAASFFELGVDENCLDALYADMGLLYDVICENPDILKVLAAPTIGKDEKHKMLDDAFGETLTRYTQNFLHLLVDKRRIAVFEDIGEEFRRLYREKNGIIQAFAITARPLEGELVQKLTDKLEQITGKKIELINNIDTTVIGGLLLQMEGEQFDSSIRGRLEGLRKQMGEAIA